ncbi:MAG: threonine synthase [Bacilli bacterium]
MVKSTREKTEVTESQAIINGLAHDGGLYIFSSFPKIKLNNILDMDYKSISIKILSLLLKDYTENEIREAVMCAYDSKFDTQEIVKVKEFDNCAILELFHGPTLAFKDMALTILPELLKIAKRKNKVSKDTIILTATSGDTGGATLSGFAHVLGMKVVVFYPNNGVSEIQEKQMLSFKSKTAHVIAFNGNFDDTQNLVKDKFKEYPYLSSANSINIGRLAPQVIYYFYAYKKMVNDKKIKLGEEINICVPTGNFGNILGAYIAYLMGLPVNKFICASNKNKVLTDFFETGIYNKNREFYKTNSPSMDILISSNLERLLYLFGADCTKLMNDLKNTGQYEVNDEIKEKMKKFVSGYSNDSETLDTIKEVYQTNNYLLDPHTAVAYKVFKDENCKEKTLIVSTASPFKFPDAVTSALGVTANSLDEKIQEISKASNVTIPKPIFEYKMNEKEVWNKEDTNVNFCKLMEELKYDKYSEN